LIRYGQYPEALIISCSDSRIDPAIITASEPGDLFVVRNVAAIVPPYEENGDYHGTSAAIEYAVKALEVGNIIVMGHALCGGVKALLNKDITEKEFDFIGPWIGIGESAREEVENHLHEYPEELRLKALEQAMILTSLKNLLTFPWVREAVEKKQLILHGWYFDMAGGKLEALDIAEGRFKDIFKFPKNAPGPCCCEQLSLGVFLSNLTRTTDKDLED
jgi:carbonic anhydrase